MEKKYKIKTFFSRIIGTVDPPAEYINSKQLNFAQEKLKMRQWEVLNNVALLT